MQVVAVEEKEKTKGCPVKAPKIIVVKVEKKMEERKTLMKFGDIDDIIRVMESLVNELRDELPVEIRTILSKTESELEVLKLKDRVPAGFGIVRETPPILLTLEELEKKLRVLQGPELTEMKKRLSYLRSEKEFILKEKTNKK